MVEPELPTAHTDRVDEEVHERPVGDAERQEDAEVYR